MEQQSLTFNFKVLVDGEELIGEVHLSNVRVKRWQLDGAYGPKGDQGQYLFDVVLLVADSADTAKAKAQQHVEDGVQANLEEGKKATVTGKWVD